MDNVETHQRIQKKEIRFTKGINSKLVVTASGTNADEILKALEIEPPQACILILGSAASLDESLRPRLTQLFSRGIAKAAIAAEALIIDGGTDTGVMTLMGQGVAARGNKSTLLGVAPTGKAIYPDGPDLADTPDAAQLEPNHSHFVLVESEEWGDERETMFALAGTMTKIVPVITLVIGGGKLTRQEILQSVRQGWQHIILEGSGGVADEIALLQKKPPAFIEDPVMAEIIADGKFSLFSIKGTVHELERTIIRHLRGDTSLRLA